MVGIRARDVEVRDLRIAPKTSQILSSENNPLPLTVIHGNVVFSELALRGRV